MPPIALIIKGLESVPVLITLFATLAADAKRAGRMTPEEDAALAAAVEALQNMSTKPSWWQTDAEREAAAGS